MEKQTEEFIKELDKLNQEKWKEIYEALKSVTDIHSITFNIYPSEEMLSKFKLNDNINFSVMTEKGTGKMEYFYKGMKIEPDCYYLRPDNYTEVTLLEILQECIVQDTYNPDIKQLESR